MDQIDSSTIDGNVELVQSQSSCILTSQVSIQFLCPTKSIRKQDIHIYIYIYVACSRPNGWTEWAEIFVDTHGWPLPGGITG